MSDAIRLGPWAEYDLSTAPPSWRASRKLERPWRDDVVRALWDLAEGEPALDVVWIKGHPPWQRLRCDDFTVVFRRTGDGGYYVARIVDRKELERALDAL